MTLKNLRNYGTGLLASLCLVMGLASCQAANDDFCETTQDCGGSEVCTGSACVSGAPGDAGPLATKPDATDGLAVCPTDTHQCLPGPPQGWIGPSLRADGPSDAAPAACPSGLDRIAILQHELNAPGSCGCSCAEPTGVTCTLPNFQGRDGDIDEFTCFATCTADYCSRQSYYPGECTPLSTSVRGRENLMYENSLVSGGLCGAGTISNDLEEPSFARQTSLCAVAETSDGCSEGNTCAPKTPVELEGQTCIFQEGEHECPASSVYTERLVTFASYDDQRSCDSCDCEFDGVNTVCGALELFDNDPDCTGTPIDVGACAAMPNLFAGQAKFTKNPQQVSCDATPNPVTSGEVVGVGATTVCCTAP